MKILKIALLACGVMVFAPSFAQKVTKKVTKEICECYNKIDQKSPTESLKQESETCIVQGMMNNLEGLMKEYKFKEGDEAAANKMANEIAMKLAKDCPSFLSVLLIIENDKKEPAEGQEIKGE